MLVLTQMNLLERQQYKKKSRRLFSTTVDWLQQPSRTRGQSTLSSVALSWRITRCSLTSSKKLDCGDVTAALKTLSDTWKQAYDENGCSKDAPIAVHKRILLKVKTEF